MIQVCWCATFATHFPVMELIIFFLSFDNVIDWHI